MYYAKRRDDQFYDWFGHTLDVAACMARLLEHHERLNKGLTLLLECPAPLMSEWLIWAAVRHDVGKLSQSFQRMLTVGEPQTVRHDSLGWALWHDHLARNVNGKLRKTADMLVRTTTGHHGSPPSQMKLNQPISFLPHGTTEDVEFAWGALRKIDKIIQQPAEALDPKKLQRATWWIAGATVVADWLGSNTEWFPYAPVDDLAAHWARSLDRADVAINQSGLIQSRLNAPASIREIDPNWETRPLQNAAMTLDVSGPLCAVIEDAMGAGKTEAALILAGRLIANSRAERLYWALPTVATSNSLYERLSNYCPDAQRTLTHGYPVKLHAEHATPWLLGDNRRRLFAPLSAGTVDQLMLAAMFSKYSVLRLLGVLGSVLVFDEIHAADGYMLKIIKSLIELHAMMGGSVILLSATLPLSFRTDLVNAWRKGRGLAAEPCAEPGYPALVHASGAHITSKTLPKGATKSIRIEHLTSESDVIAQLMLEAKRNRCAVWVCTTVNEAICRYQKIKQETDSYEISDHIHVMLFHSRFVVTDRNRIEETVIQRFGKDSEEKDRAGWILIATQVVEQSLDLDFDFMVTDAAPVDLVFQRVGRLHRHERGTRGTPTLCLHAPPLDGDWNISAQYVYDGMMPHIWMSTKLLLDKGSIELPDDLRPMVEHVYAHNGKDTPLGPPVDPEIQARAKADMAVVRPSAGYDGRGRKWLPDSAYTTRLGEPSRIVALIDEFGKPLKATLAESAIRFQDRWKPREQQYGESNGWTTVSLASGNQYSTTLGLLLEVNV